MAGVTDTSKILEWDNSNPSQLPKWRDSNTCKALKSIILKYQEKA
jgi:hypothetical protein